MLAALPLPVLLLDADDRFRFANHAAETLLGLSVTALAQLHLSDLIPRAHPVHALLRDVRDADATVADHDVLLQGPRLRPLRVGLQATPLPEEPGSILLTLTDTGAARALDRHMTVRGAARSASGMAAILAHEVKNPLSGIRGAAQLLEASVAPEDRELTVLIRDEADRIRALIDRMEVFGDRPLERGPVNIHRVLEHVRRLAASGFAAHLRFVEEYDPSLPPVLGARDQLVQVVLNLVKNAAEAITEAGIEGGEITLTTAYQHGLRLATRNGAERTHLPLVVTVRDNGPGIPEELRATLFEPFVSTRAGGSGLGLALVAKLIADHGGLVEADSRPGRTEFRLHLPMDSDEVAR